MSEEFKPGDVVQLKSGGPKMTVKKIEMWNSVMSANCDWFENADVKYELFPVTSLKKVEESAPAVRVAKPGTSWS